VTALHPSVQWWIAWPATGAGIVCADMVLYGIGRLWGRRLFDYRWVQRIIKPERRQRIEDKFHGHGMKILLTARLLPPLRTGVFIIAGALHFPFSRFLLADLVYAVFGVGLFFFGSTWIIELMHRVGHWLIYVAAAVVGVYLLYHYFGHLKKRELRGTAEPPVSVLEVPVQNPAADQPASRAVSR